MTDRVRLHENCGLQCQLLFLLDIVCYIRQLLLHHTDGLKVGRVVERVAAQ